MFVRRNRRVVSWKTRLHPAGVIVLLRSLRVGRSMVIVALLIAAAVGGWKAWQHWCQSQHFVLAQVDVVGTSHMLPEEVVIQCGLEVGTTDLLFVSASAVEDACETSPRVREAVVEVLLPDRVRIHVQEQTPILAVATRYGLYAVNELGEAFAPLEPEEFTGLPLLVPHPEASLPHATWPKGTANREALALVGVLSFPSSPWLDHPLRIGYRPLIGLDVVNDSAGIRVHFGKPPFARKFDRLLDALAVARDQSLLVDEVRVDNSARPHEVTLRVTPKAPATPASDPRMTAAAALPVAMENVHD